MADRKGPRKRTSSYDEDSSTLSDSSGTISRTKGSRRVTRTKGSMRASRNKRSRFSRDSFDSDEDSYSYSNKGNSTQARGPRVRSSQVSRTSSEWDEAEDTFGSAEQRYKKSRAPSKSPRRRSSRHKAEDLEEEEECDGRQFLVRCPIIMTSSEENNPPESSNPVCTIRLASSRYQKDIEVNLDKQMDDVIYRILKGMDDECVDINGLRLSGKKRPFGFLQHCLAPLASCFSVKPPAGRSGGQRKTHCHPCEQGRRSRARRSCSPGYNQRKSNKSASSDESCEEETPRRKKMRKKSCCQRLLQGCRKKVLCRRSCCMNDDLVLIEIIPSRANHNADVKYKKHKERGVGTDTSPELEILLNGDERCVSKMTAKKCPCRVCVTKSKKKCKPKQKEEPNRNKEAEEPFEEREESRDSMESDDSRAPKGRRKRRGSTPSSDRRKLSFERTYSLLVNSNYDPTWDSDYATSNSLIGHMPLKWTTDRKTNLLTKGSKSEPLNVYSALQERFMDVVNDENLKHHQKMLLKRKEFDHIGSPTIDKMKLIPYETTSRRRKVSSRLFFGRDYILELHETSESVEETVKTQNTKHQTLRMMDCLRLHKMFQRSEVSMTSSTTNAVSSVPPGTECKKHKKTIKLKLKKGDTSSSIIVLENEFSSRLVSEIEDYSPKKITSRLNDDPPLKGSLKLEPSKLHFMKFPPTKKSLSHRGASGFIVRRLLLKTRPTRADNIATASFLHALIGKFLNQKGLIMFSTRTLVKDSWSGARRLNAGRRLSSTRQHHQTRLMLRNWRRPFSSTHTRAASTQDGSVRGLFPDEPVPEVPFPEYLWSKSHKWADATAVTCGVSNRKVSYKDLQSRCSAFGGALLRDLGLKTNDRVAVLLPNCAEFIVASIGAMKAGIIPTTMNPMYTPDEVAHQLKDSGASAAVTLVQFLPTMMKAAKLAGMEGLKIVVLQKGEEPLPANVFTMQDLVAAGDTSVVDGVKRTPDDIALLPYSSGTTGRPKGVMLTNRNITSNLQALNKKQDHIERTGNKTEVIPLILPMFHIYGFAISSLTLFCGGEIISLPKFEEETFLRSLEKATILYVAPPLVIYLGASPRVTSATVKTLKSVVSGAAPCASSDIQRVANKMPQAAYAQGYGLTETSPLVCSTPKNVDNPSSVGPPALNTYVKVIDVESGKALGPEQPGEIVVKGPQVMKGYWNNQKATDEVLKDGWFYTGDIGYYDSNNYFYITDRLKELIKVKGFQVAPAELEGILRSHPDVMDAGVVGAPDPIKGEKPVAFVALTPGTKKDPEVLKAFLHDKVAKFKRVDDFIFVDAIPKSAAGKILRKELRKIINK
ncbi:hypothetical protein GE061_012149 [Apolygus lucorum]|uniref:Luciferin 4-monooxygenase n=1 Tax=Apolygus lucorum TaxID=248454 RepID=A0A8S9XU62_APOLU|nr:hypothetical protein GE061_012149 [Apolygus lucorum]